ncbi:FAD-dependent oxidoreductase [Rhodococcus aetherivorans]|uniref:FAD-dependent oxidoreductase n=1 Tax=Rhodococcus aetherivorans TaxID=191292 RepID=UPI00045C7480|nr:FAD-dependent oxidoreductase [Rhodococcus aetherivorans]KDE12013.1 FAD-dependent oxidoreductase [Rhodococcus aetherivorans]
MTSLWLSRPDTARTDDTPWPEGPARFDTVVVGAGLTGMATALLLARAGHRVAVLEARTVGAVTAGNTTGKISLLQGSTLSSIARGHSRDVLRNYVAGNLEAQRWVVQLCRERGLPIESAAAFTYSAGEEGVATVRAEHEACRAVGLDARMTTETELPYPVAAAVTLPDQAQIDPMPLLHELARELRERDGALFTGCRVRKVRSDRNGCVAVTDHGEVRAGHIVLATGTPILDRGGFFARLEPQRSYAAAFEVPGDIPSGMYLSVDSPTRSLRTAYGGRYFLVGGNGHTVGRAHDHRGAADDLVAWTGRHFPGAKTVARWSAQDYATLDHLPYVGPLLPGNDRLLVGTGYGKWGMTNAVAAARLLSARILGETAPEWESAFQAWSPTQLFDLPAATRLNAAVAVEMTRGWVRAELSGDGASPPEGRGTVRREKLRPVGVCTVDGTTHRVSAVCPHLGGVLRWNDAEASWDCPLHGSRFAADGRLLEGPATRDLAPE